MAIDQDLTAISNLLQPGQPSPKAAVLQDYSVVDSYTKEAMADLLMPTQPKERTAEYPVNTPYDTGRLASEVGADIPLSKEDPSLLSSVLPGRKEQLAYLTPSIWGGADLSNLKDAPLANAYKLRKLANEQGYDVLFTSGARQGGGKSYHDHGEAVDVRFQRIGKSGQKYDLTPQEEVAMGKKFAKAAGWASLLDEINFDPSGRKTGAHLHLSHGVEHNLLGDPSHHLLNKRSVGDDNYLKLNPNSPTPPAGEKTRSGLAAAAEVMANAHGVDSDVFVRLIQAESNFDPKAKSSQGASGLGQMMPGTITEVAKELGVSPDTYYTHPNMQLRFSLHYFKKQLDANQGNYARALAAYNAGPGNLEEFKQGKPVYNETKNYVWKILNEIDPAVTDEDHAALAVAKGYGRTADPNKSIQTVKDHLADIRNNGQSFWQDLSSGVADAFDPKSELNLGRQGGYLLNEFANQFSLGFIPMFQSSLDTAKARQELLDDEGLLTRVAGIAPVGAARLAGMLGGGTMLLKALRSVPIFSSATRAAGLKAADYFGESVNPLINAIKTISAGSLGKAAGGPLALLTADLMEQASVGGLQMGTYGFMNWLYDKDQDHNLTDGLKTFALNSVVGGGLAVLFGIGLPLAGSLGLNVAGNALGKNAAAGSMAEVLGKYYQGQSGLGKALTRTGAGAVSGSLLSGLMDVTGVSEEVFGKDVFFEGGSVGAGLGLGAPILAKAVDWSGVSRLVAKMPGMETLKQGIGSTIDKLNEAQMSTLAQHAFDAVYDVRNLERAHYVGTNAEVGKAGMQLALDDIKSQHTTWLQQISSIEKEKQVLDSNVNSLLASQMEIENKFPRGKNYLDSVASLEQEFSQTQQQLQQAQTQPPQTGPVFSAFSVETQLQLSRLIGESASALDRIVGETPQQVAARAGKGSTLIQQAELQQKLAETGTKLQMMREQFGKDKDLASEVQRIQLGMDKLKVANAQYAQKSAELFERYKAAKGAADGLEFAAAEQDKVFQKYSATAESAKDSADFNVNWGQEVDMIPFESTSARSAVNPSKVKEAYQTHLTDFVDSYIKPILFSGVDFNSKAYAAGLASDAVALATDESYRTVSANTLESMKTKLNDLKAALPEGDSAITRAISSEAVVSSPGSVKAKMKKSVPTWGEPGKKTVMVKTSEIFDGLLDSMPELDFNTLEETAIARKRELVNNKEVQPIGFSNLKDHGIDLLREAKAHLDLGEEFMPVTLDGLSSRDFRDKVVKPLFAQGKISEVLRLEEGVKNLDQLLNGTLESPIIKPLRTSARGKADEPISGDESMWAQEARPREVFNFRNTFRMLQGRLNSLQQQLQNQAPTMAESMTNFIKSGGDLNLAPTDVRDFITSGKNLDKAPTKVREWIDLHTSLHMEEVARQRWLDKNIIGSAQSPKGEKFSVVSAERERRAAGLPDAPKNTDEALIVKFVAENIMLADSGDIRATNQFVTDLAMSDRLDFKQIAGITHRGWRDLVVNRANTAEVIMERMIKPTFEKRYLEFEQKLGKALVPAEKEGFFREFADAIEDVGEMKNFRKKYGGNVDDLLQTHYSFQSLFEFIRANSPELYDWARANYWPHRWRKLAAYNAAAEREKQVGISAELAGEHMREFDNLKAADRQRQAFRDELKKKNITEEEFLGVFDESRAKAYEFGKGPDADRQWNNLNGNQKEELLTKASKNAMLLLSDDPVVDPLELYQMQLSSIWRADGIRRLLRTWNNTAVPITTNKDAVRHMKIMEVSESPSTSLISDGFKAESYRRLDKMDNFRHVKFRTTEGLEINSSQIWLHPAAFDYLADFAGGMTKQPGALERGWQRAMGLLRNQVLLGTFIPHLMQITTGSMAEFWKTPARAANLMGAGKRIESQGLEGAAVLAEAVRHGLNVRTFEQGTKSMAQSLVQEMGIDFANKLYGIEDKPFLRWLQSMDMTDPMQKEAKAMLGKMGKFTSDILGTSTQLDYLVNREMLFKPIEQGQLAGYYFRVMEYLKNHSKELAELPPQERMRTAQMAAADMTNRLSGSLPAAWGNSGVRKLITNTVLTPQWFMSKAYTIADGLDSLLFLGARKLSGGKLKESVLEKAFNRRAFDQYDPKVRVALRNRMAGMISAGLMGSFLMANATQYLVDGTFSVNHPPDKWFHIHNNGTYYTGPVIGYVRDVLRFAGDLFTADTVEADASPAGVVSRFMPAVSKAVERQLLPPVEQIGKLLLDPKVRGQLSDNTVDSLAAYLNDYAGKASAAPEVIGLDSRTANLEDVMNKLSSAFRSEESTEKSRAKALSASQYYLRLLGTYDSKEQTVLNLRGDLYDRQRNIENSALRELTPYLNKLRSSHLGGDVEGAYKYHTQLMQAWSKGVAVKDKLLKQQYPGEVYRLSSKQLNSLIDQIYSPQKANMQGAVNTPIGRALLQEMNNYERDGSIMMDATEQW